MAKVLLQRPYPFLPKTHLVLHITLVLTIFQTQIFRFSYSSKPTGFSLKLIPRDSPESPLYPGNLTQTQQVERLINFSKAREEYLKFSLASSSVLNISTNGTLEPQKIQMGFYRERFYHIVQTQLGTPILDVQFLAMGSSGSLVWTQCMPWTRCYEQTDSIYDSGASLSYRKLLCSHPLCQGTQARYQCVNDECVYNIRYGGGNIGPTKGVVSVETFRFVRKDGIIQVLDGIIFGCSNDNMNFKDFEGTLISGILGLSWSPDSLAAQLANFVERRFSYCLVAYSKTQAGPSMLTFGTAVPTLIGNLQTTNFVGPPNNQYLFYLRLLDISVGWDRIGFPSDTFKLNYQDGSGGLVIDTGAVMSHFNNQDVPNGRNPYKEVIRAFQKHYDSFNLKRKENETHGFELCYESPLRGFKQFATLTYHFEGADYIVDGRYVNYFNDEEGYFCVALVPGNGVSILGAWQQQNKRIVYNGDINVLQFVDEDCK